MTLPVAVRLPLHADVEALRRDVDAIAPDAWEPHFNTQQYEGEWSGVALRVAAGAPLALYPDPVSDTYVDTALLAACPATAALLDSLRCQLQTVRFLRLGPGARITEHRDYRLSYADGEVRLHVPVSTSADVEFRLAGEQVDMRAGDVWYVDLTQPHQVVNRGSTARVHLVIDCVVDEWLTGQLELGHRGCPP